jgi:multidrug efflux pump subunit AcrA (membrane-fusion protein)
MMEVKINFTDGSEGLKAGMFVEAKIVTKEKENVIKLPIDCVVERFGEDYVFVVSEATSDDGQQKRWTVSKRKVTTGIEIDRKVEILEGLEAGEQVVYRGQTLLEQGSKVRVVSKVQPLSSEDVLE